MFKEEEQYEKVAKEETYEERRRRGLQQTNLWLIASVCSVLLLPFVGALCSSISAWWSADTGDAFRAAASAAGALAATWAAIRVPKEIRDAGEVRSKQRNAELSVEKKIAAAIELYEMLDTLEVTCDKIDKHIELPHIPNAGDDYYQYCKAGVIHLKKTIDEATVKSRNFDFWSGKSRPLIYSQFLETNELINNFYDKFDKCDWQIDSNMKDMIRSKNTVLRNVHDTVDLVRNELFSAMFTKKP